MSGCSIVESTSNILNSRLPKIVAYLSLLTIIGVEGNGPMEFYSNVLDRYSKKNNTGTTFCCGILYIVHHNRTLRWHLLHC